MSVPLARPPRAERAGVAPRVETAPLRITDAPPADWNARIASPTLSPGFAAAAASSGYRALYVEGSSATALVLVRIVPASMGRAASVRAKAYVSRGDAVFVSALVQALATRGIAHVWVGDTVEGVPRHTLERAGVVPVMSYRLAHAPALSDRELFERLAPRRRAALRRAELDGVVVGEIHDEAELDQYAALAAAADTTGALVPAKFFAAMFRDMVPRRQAVFFLARRGDRPLAGAIFLVSRYRMSCFHAAATRDQGLSALEGPTAVFWHALRVARVRDLPCFDLGAVTPAAHRDRPALASYEFKREFGGYLEPVHHGEVAPSRLRQALLAVTPQPTWQRTRAEATDRPTPAATREITSGLDVAWTGAPTSRASRSAVWEPWTVDDVAADISALVPLVREASFFAIALAQEARRKVLAFARVLHATHGAEIARPSVASEANGSIRMRWSPDMTGSRQLVELVFFREAIEYAVLDGDDTSPRERWPLLGGRTTDADEVLREIVKPYVVRSAGEGL